MRGRRRLEILRPGFQRRRVESGFARSDHQAFWGSRYFLAQLTRTKANVSFA